MQQPRRLLVCFKCGAKLKPFTEAVKSLVLDVRHVPYSRLMTVFLGDPATPADEVALCVPCGRNLQAHLEKWLGAVPRDASTTLLDHLKIKVREDDLR